MHKVFEQVQDSITIPLIHIADATADAIKDSGYKKVALIRLVLSWVVFFYDFCEAAIRWVVLGIGVAFATAYMSQKDKK